MAYCKPTAGEDRKGRGPTDLSGHEHFPEGGHNTEYDHEAFLGKEEAERFDQLTPEEAKERLALIVNKVDKNTDGFVTEEELKEWIRHVSRKYIASDVQRHLSYTDRDKNQEVMWEEYKRGTFGDGPHDPSDIYDKHRQQTYREAEDTDKRRFDAADLNKDGKLNPEEYGIFLHPQEYSHMKEVIVDETLSEMDKNKDGFISVDEYLSDLWPAYHQESAGKEEPDWVGREKKHFKEYRDKDKDGVLNKEELGSWIMPDGYDHVEAEAKHLIYEADIDKDKKLTKDEILKHHDLFAGSQATEFGEYLIKIKQHDEF